MNLERLIGPQVIPILLFFGLASYFDMRDQKIYDWISFSMFYYNALVFVVIPLIVKEWEIALSSTLGGIIAFAAVIIPAMVFMIKAGGDIKFAGATGIAFGAIGSIAWLLVSVILVILYGIYLNKAKGKNTWTVIPFAPFMFAGMLINVAGYLLFV